MELENGIINNKFITINTDINNNGIIHDNEYRIKEPDLYEFTRDDNTITEEESNITRPSVIYRFKFTEQFMEELYKFSKIHQYDDRKGFKEAWNIWMEENEDIIKQESVRLIHLGYSKEGDIINKMFKSARYYFRKKSSVKKQPIQRRQYISVVRELLDAMDNHIEENMFNADYQPKIGFVSFCKNNEEVLKDSLTKIFEQGIKDSKVIEDKIKKTYKNRYFMLTNKK